MATIGDPLMDLGSSLGYWVEPRDPPEMQAMKTLPTHLEGALTRKQMVAYYSKLSGRSVDHLNSITVSDYSAWRSRPADLLPVLSRQTRDPRFQSLIFAVTILEKTAPAAPGSITERDRDLAFEKEMQECAVHQKYDRKVE